MRESRFTRPGAWQALLSTSACVVLAAVLSISTLEAEDVGAVALTFNVGIADGPDSRVSGTSPMFNATFEHRPLILINLGWRVLGGVTHFDLDEHGRDRERQVYFGSAGLLWYPQSFKSRERPQLFYFTAGIERYNAHPTVGAYIVGVGFQWPLSKYDVPMFKAEALYHIVSERREDSFYSATVGIKFGV